MMSRGNLKRCLMSVALVFVMVVPGEIWAIRTASAAPPAKPIKLRMMMSGEPTPAQLSPIGGLGGIGLSELLTSNVMEPLVDVDKKGEPVPRLATKWEHSKDLTKWRFYLRKGVKFHNGADFTARDVVDLAKWSFEEKKLSRLYQRVPVKEAVAVSDYTVDLIFEAPQPLLLIMLRMNFLISPTAITRDNRKMAETHFIGTGPYQFLEWKKGQHIKLAKFEGYWERKPQIDEVEITFRAEEAVRLAALMAGEVDWVSGLTPDLAPKAPKAAHMSSPETVWLKFDEYIQKELGGESILADKRLRLAVEYAIDRQALVALYSGFATPSLGQFASPGDFGFNPDLKSRLYDLERGRALVREAGAVGKTLTFVGAADRWTKGREVAEAIAYMIEQTGLKVKLMLMPHAEARKYKISTGTGTDRKLVSDIFISPSDAPLEVESSFPDMFVKGGRYSATLDPEPARLFKEVAAETDYVKREKMLGKTWTYAYEQAHYVPLFKLESIWGIAKNLEWKGDIASRSFIADMKFAD